MRWTLLLFSIGITALGCYRVEETRIVVAESARRTESNAAKASYHTDRPSDWSLLIGKTVTLTGKAIDHKNCAALHFENSMIYVDLSPAKHWPDSLYHGGDDGETVQVTGTVAHRNMLPVFIPHPDKPMVQGMPMPEGTDLHNAAKAYVLENVEWRPVSPTKADGS